MEGKFGCYDYEKKSSSKKKEEEEEDLMKSSSSEELSFKNLSKLVVPPLGVSAAFTTNNVSNGRIISPMDTRYRCWETLMIVLVMYSAWVCPYEIAFLGSHLTPPLYIADNLVDFFFAVDIVLTFFLAYIDSTTQLLVLDSNKIAKS